MSPVRQRFFSTPSCFRANVGIRFTKAADLRVSLCFRAVSTFRPPPPTNILRIERCNRGISRKYRSRSAESCFFFAIRPLVFLPVPLISGFLWEGVRNRILMRRFSLCIPFDYHERANEAVLQVVGEGGKVSKRAVPITASANNRNSLGAFDLPFDFRFLIIFFFFHEKITFQAWNING